MTAAYFTKVQHTCGARRLEQLSANAGIIYELLLAKSGLGVISSMCVADMDFIIHYLCVCHRPSFYSLLFSCVLLYDIHNK